MNCKANLANILVAIGLQAKLNKDLTIHME